MFIKSFISLCIVFLHIVYSPFSIITARGQPLVKSCIMGFSSCITEVLTFCWTQAMIKTAVPTTHGIYVIPLLSLTKCPMQVWERCFKSYQKPALPLFFLFHQLRQAVKQALSHRVLLG